MLELQGNGGRRAEDLAATFETSVRTIYRDMQALSEAGVPVVATPGVGYALMEGYFLPPLTFTADEATVLLLGGDVVGRYFDMGYRTVAETATRKIAAVLPEKLRDAVRERSDRLRFVVPDAPSPTVEETLRVLRRAVLEEIGVSFQYYGRRGEHEGGSPTERVVNPHALMLVGRVWFLAAHDHLRGAVRHFAFLACDQCDFVVGEMHGMREHSTCVEEVVGVVDGGVAGLGGEEVGNERNFRYVLADVRLDP